MMREFLHEPRDKPITRSEVQRVLREFIKIMAVVGIINLAALGLGAWAIHETDGLAVKNHEAILTGCTLLANAITQSGSGGQANRPSPQARLTAQYVAVIVRTATPRERERITRLRQEIAKTGAGGVVTIPDCKLIADHPETVAPSVGR